MGYAIETIEGIGPAMAKKLEKAGVTRTDHLLDKGATPKGRKTLAAESGLSEAQILKWTNMADLMRIKGVGEEYSELLEAAGVDTVKELRRRKAENLAQAMADANAKKKLTRRVPSESVVAGWIDHAKELKPILKY